jgi:hypothetical protein
MWWAIPNSHICNWKKNAARTRSEIVVTTWWGGVTVGQKHQSNQAQKVYLVGPGGLEPPTKRL